MGRIARLGMALTEAVAEYALGDACPPPEPEDDPAPRVDPEVAARWLPEADVPLAFTRLTRIVRIATVTRADMAARRRVLAGSLRPGGGGAGLQDHAGEAEARRQAGAGDGGRAGADQG